MTWKSIELSPDEIAETRKDRKKARFLVDESVDPAVARVMADAGFDANHATEVGLAGHPDEDVLALAHREDRILLTHDPDFLDNRKFPHHRNPGLIVLPGSQGDKHAILETLDVIFRTIAVSRELWRRTKIVFGDATTWTVNTFEPDYGRVVQTRYRFGKGDRVEVWEE